MIISASRRTDIPAFHSEWFMNRIRAGYVLVRNPHVRSTVYSVPLTPSAVDCTVFITKDPSPMIRHIDELRESGIQCAFQVTITPYGRDVEPNVPPVDDVVSSFKELSEILGRERMAWRYDPVLMNDDIGVGYHTEMFDRLCGELTEYADRCTFTLLDVYDKIDAHIIPGKVRRPSEEEANKIMTMMSGTAKRHGLELDTCSTLHATPIDGIRSRGCMDAEWFRRMGVPYVDTISPTREGCTCIKSVDIGMYDTCGHDCIYCYANSSSVSRRHGKDYDPEAEMLYGVLESGDNIIRLKGSRNLRITGF